MKVFMIGTPTCTKCKSMRPRIEEYCSNQDIIFNYMNLNQVSKDIYTLLISNNIKSAPAFIIYRSEADQPVLVSGDDVFFELKCDR